ncbi:MAG TPA: hypothetical protein VGM39_04580 [Kofleriaceae bacterium]
MVKRICPLCEACCGLEITVEDERITAIRADAADVLSQGFICPKGAALGELQRSGSPARSARGAHHAMRAARPLASVMHYERDVLPRGHR